MIDIAALEARAKQIKGSIVNATAFRRRHGLATKNPVDHTHAVARREHALRLREEGLTFVEIGARFGVTRERARQLAWMGEQQRRKQRQEPDG